MFTRIGDIERMFERMGLLREGLDHIFEGYDRSVVSGAGGPVRSTYPRTNLADSGDHFEMVAEIPGLSRDDINVKIQGNYLEISGTRTISAPEGYRVHRSERGSTTFTRSLTLPADVASEKVSASLKDGLLVLHLPKSEAAKPRQISIN